MGNHMNTLEQIKRETRDDARLYACIRDLYDQGVSLSDLKALIPVLQDSFIFPPKDAAGTVLRLSFSEWLQPQPVYLLYKLLHTIYLRISVPILLLCLLREDYLLQLAGNTRIS